MNINSVARVARLMNAIEKRSVAFSPMDWLLFWQMLNEFRRKREIRVDAEKKSNVEPAQVLNKSVVNAAQKVKAASLNVSDFSWSEEDNPPYKE